MAVDWRVAVLRKLGAPPTKQNLKFLSAWQRWEGGHTNNSATWNWLNTTMGDSYKAINDVGVRAFPNFDVGTSYTAQTINNGRYTNIIKGLRAGNPYKFNIRGDLSTWVSGSPTGNLDYAARVLGTTVSPQETQVPKGSLKPTKTAQQVPRTEPKDQSAFWQKRLSIVSKSLTGFMDSYIKTGEITSNGYGQLLGLLDKLGTVSPPKMDKAIPKVKSQKTKQVDPAASGVMAKILEAAHKQVGQPYVWGGESRAEGGFDCSGLIQWAYDQVGIQIPRVTTDQIKAGRAIPWGKFKPGDLIFSNKGGHVVMYVGGGKVIAAPHTGTVVQYQPVSRFKNSFVTARRIVG